MEHTRAQIRAKNAEWIDANVKGADPQLYKYAKETAESYIRTMMMEDAITDEILPPEQISAEDCDRTLTSLKPYKIVEVEPEVEFPNTIAIDFSNDKLILAGSMEVGGIYDVNFSISCKKTEKGGIFNTIRGRKITAVKTPDEKEAEEVLPF